MSYASFESSRKRTVADLREGERFETERGRYTYLGDNRGWDGRDLCVIDPAERVNLLDSAVSAERSL